MAKGSKIVAGGVDRDLLSQIVVATNSGSFVYTSVTAHQPMLANSPPLVEVNTSMVDPTDATKFATRATAGATTYLAAPAVPSANANGNGEAHKYAIITNAKLPDAKKRGGSFGAGAPTKYPFAEMEVGTSFFSANTEHAKGDAVKALGSTISAQNNKYSEPVMENGVVKTKTVTRAVRDPKTKKAVVGSDGKKVTETVNLPAKSYSRKFTIRPVTGGEKYGDWTAPADGALVARTQ